MNPTQQKGRTHMAKKFDAKQFMLEKGEYVGRSERTKVPVWRYTREMFTIPTDPSPLEVSVRPKSEAVKSVTSF